MNKSTQEHKSPQNEQAPNPKKSQVWDCESSLYDSFELKSFKRHLDSAILTSRTQSMPHISDRRTTLPPPPPPPPLVKKTSKLSRSFNKLLKSIFGSSKPKPAQVLESKPDSTHLIIDYEYLYDDDDHDVSSTLSTIPEVSEDYVGLSPELSSIVRKTKSERFTASSIGISCA